jgi:L-malate glycosyltransferase
MNSLYLIGELSNSDGVSSHCYNLLSALIADKKMKIYVICSGGDAIDKFRNLGIKVFIYKTFSFQKRSYSNYLFSCILLFKFVLKEKIDIIHSHNHYMASIAFRVSKISKVKTVQTNHGLFPEVGRLNHYSAHFLIVVNDHIKEYLDKNKLFSSDKVSLIRSGIKPPSTLACEEKVNDKIKFIAASRLIKEKGFDVYLKAVSILPQKFKENAEFYFAGKGEYEIELLILNKNLKSKVIFLGEILNLKDRLCNYDVFVLPSESEGFPMTLIEAGLSKCLVISSNFLGLNSVFENEKDGLLFKKGDHHDLAEKIEFVIENFDKLHYLREHFYDKVKVEFSLEKMVSETVELYKKCLSQ